MERQKEIAINNTNVFRHSYVAVACRLLLISCILFFLLPTANCQLPTDLYKSANQLYKANQFETAAADYEKIAGQGYRSAEVYYNLGNCYYKLNNVGKAIINYERALKLSPDDEDIQHNLKLANLRTLDKVQPVPQMGIVTRWNNFVSSNSSRGWGWLAVISIWVTLLIFAGYLFLGRFRLLMNAGVLFLIISFSCIFLAFKQSDKEQDSDSAILTVSNVSAKSAPDVNGSDQFIIHEGTKFTLLDRVGEWDKIRLADGKVGWIEKGSFEKI